MRSAWWWGAACLAWTAAGVHCGGSENRIEAADAGDAQASDASFAHDSATHDAAIADARDEGASSASEASAGDASDEGCEAGAISNRAGTAKSTGYSGTTIAYGDLFDVPCTTATDCLAPCVAAGGTSQSCAMGNQCLPGPDGDSGLPNHCLPPCYWLDLIGAIGTGSQIMPANDTQAFDNGYSDTLMLTQFGLAVPADAAILGIEFSVDRSATDSLASDASVLVLRSGSVAGTNHASKVAWPTTYTSAVYGGAGDTWGIAGWTAADLNDPGFGIAITPQYPSSAGAGTVDVDSVTATVFYRTRCP